MRADRDAPKRRRSHCVSHRDCVAGVEATGDVGRGHEIEECLVLQLARAAKALSEVRAEIYAEWQAGVPLFFTVFLLAVHRLGLDDLP